MTKNNVEKTADTNVTQLRTDRAARRAKRAEHMKNLANEARSASIEVEKDENNNKDINEVSKAEENVEKTTNRMSTSITIKTQKTEKLEEATPKVEEKPKEESKPMSRVALRNKQFTSNESGLKRTGTWSPNKTTTGSGGFAASKAKFGGQAGSSPFEFGLSYSKKKEHSSDGPSNSLNKNAHTNVSPSYSPTHNTSRSSHFKIEEAKVFPKRKESINKYKAVVFPNTESEPEPMPQSPTKMEFGLNFAPKSNKFRPSSELINNNKYHVPQEAPSFNKYNASMSPTKDSFIPYSRVNSEVITSNTSMVSPFTVKKEDCRRTISENIFNRTSNINNGPTLDNDRLKGKSFNASSIISRSIIARTASSNEQATTNRPKSTFVEQASNNLQPSTTGNRPRSWMNDRSSITNRQSVNKPTSFKPEAEPPSLGASTGGGMSAADRMAMFREAEEKQKKDEERKKAREEERKRLAEEAEKKKKEEEERKKKEEEEKQQQAKEKPDSEKMKHAAPCMKKREKKKVTRRTMSISSIVLDWVQEMVKDYPGVEVKNFSSSWNNGMAFCALIHKFNPNEFDFNELKPENKRYNFDLAFNTGMKVKNIPILLDTEDMVRMPKPEPRSVQTYIQWVWSVYGPTSGYGPTPQEVQSATLS